MAEWGRQPLYPHHLTTCSLLPPAPPTLQCLHSLQPPPASCAPTYMPALTSAFPPTLLTVHSLLEHRAHGSSGQAQLYSSGDKRQQLWHLRARAAAPTAPWQSRDQSVHMLCAPGGAWSQNHCKQQARGVTGTFPHCIHTFTL